MYFFNFQIFYYEEEKLMVSSLNDNKYGFDNATYQATSNMIDKTAHQFQVAAISVKESFCNLQREAVSAFQYLKITFENSNVAPVVSKANRLSSDIERVMNLAGCIPGVSAPSGIIRSSFGVAQTIAGIAILIISELGYYFSSQNPDVETLKNKWKTLSAVGLEYTIHGCLNSLKGSAETFIGSYLFGLGSFLLILPNTFNDRDFDPYFTYGTLTNRVFTEI